MLSRAFSTGALTALAFSVLAASPASAQLVDPATPEAIAAQLKASGFAAEVHAAAGDKGPGISSHTAGVDFDISFDACTDDGKRCQVMVFTAPFFFKDPDKRPSKADLNRWNLTEYGKAVANGNGDPWLDFEIISFPARRVKRSRYNSAT